MNEGGLTCVTLSYNARTEPEIPCDDTKTEVRTSCDNTTYVTRAFRAASSVNSARRGGSCARMEAASSGIEALWCKEEEEQVTKGAGRLRRSTKQTIVIGVVGSRANHMPAYGDLQLLPNLAHGWCSSGSGAGNHLICTCSMKQRWQGRPMDFHSESQRPEDTILLVSSLHQTAASVRRLQDQKDGRDGA